MTTPGLPEQAAAETALLLDFDGTLVSLAEHPDAVVLPERQRRLLGALMSRWSHALAIISGRRLTDLERLTSPLNLTLIGCHGAEWRNPDGTYWTEQRSGFSTSSIMRALDDFCRRHPGTLYEDKTYAFTLHYRQAPQHQAACQDVMWQLWQAHQTHFSLSEGKCVLELRHHSCHKGHAIEALLEIPPFSGRTPVFIGDDRTDEDAFPVVNVRNGISIRVGHPADTTARYRLGSVEEVLTWLEFLLATNQLR